MSRGIDRERQVRRLLEAQGYWTCRAAGSFGDADVVALMKDAAPLLVEVKSTAASPFNDFGPVARAELSAAARQCGGVAALCWWPPRKPPRWFYEQDWPKVKEAA